MPSSRTTEGDSARGQEIPTSPAPLRRSVADALSVAVSVRAGLFVVVATLFCERLEKDRYLSGAFPIPDLFFTLAVLALGARILVEREERRRVILLPTTLKEIVVGALPFTLAMLSLLAILVLPASMTSTHHVSKTSLHLFFLSCAAIALGRVLSANRLVPFALKSYFAISVFISIIAVLQTLDENLVHTGISQALGLGSRSSGGFERAYATWSEPAYLGYSTIASVLIGLWLIRGSRTTAPAVGVAISLVALVLSGSAGALILAPVVLLILLSTRKLASRAAVLKLAAAGAVVIAILIPTEAGHYAVDRMTGVVTGSDASVKFRREVNDALLEIWEKAPYTGVGLGDSRLFLPRLVHLNFMPNFVLLAPSTNVYLGLLAEAGPLGVLSLLGLLLILLLRTQSSRELEALTRVLIVLMALEFALIGAFLLPPFWFWASLRLGLDRETAR